MTTRILLRGGCVLTLGARTPNFPRADLLVEDGRVAEVGTGLRARDAEVIDASHAIVMPGFVDTHRHTWTSLFRNLGDDPSIAGSMARLADHYGPEDVYAATLIGLLGALEAGITTVVDWSDLDADEDLSDAALQAHADAGVRTVLVHALRRGNEDDDAGRARRRVLTRLAGAAGPSTTLALGSSELGPTDLDGVGAAWGMARELGVRIHAHVGSGTAPGAISQIAARGLLAEDVTLVHCPRIDTADLAAVAASRASVSLAPASDMTAGLGPPPIQHVVDHGIRPGLGVGDERESPGDLFAQMRAAISFQHAAAFDRKLAGKASVPRLMSTRDAIRFATVDGAGTAGLGTVTGSLERGRQADVVVLRTDRPNVFPINDPIGAVVWGMDTSNVDTVIVGGRIRVRGGALEADVSRARALATAARGRVAAAAGLAVGAARGSAS